jgi:hypothetical protein
MLLGCFDVDQKQGHKSHLAANHKFAAEKCGWATIVVSSQVPHLGSCNRQMATGTRGAVVISPLHGWFMTVVCPRAVVAVVRPRQLLHRGWRRRSSIDHMSGN